jgi:hypothetical protein
VYFPLTTCLCPVVSTFARCTAFGGGVVQGVARYRRRTKVARGQSAGHNRPLSQLSWRETVGGTWLVMWWKLQRACRTGCSVASFCLVCSICTHHYAISQITHGGRTGSVLYNASLPSLCGEDTQPINLQYFLWNTWRASRQGDVNGTLLNGWNANDMQQKPVLVMLMNYLCVSPHTARHSNSLSFQAG